MKTRTAIKRSDLDFLCIRAYHYLEGYKLTENDVEQIITSFKLDEIESTRLIRKIKRLKQKHRMSIQNLARAIVKTKYTSRKESYPIPFDEYSPLAVI